MNGIGDVIARVTEATGIKTVAEAIANLVGAEGCGCKERQEYLNQLFPFEGYKREFIVPKDFQYMDATYPEGELVVTREHPLFSSVIHLTEIGLIVEKL